MHIQAYNKRQFHVFFSERYAWFSTLRSASLAPAAKPHPLTHISDQIIPATHRTRLRSCHGDHMATRTPIRVTTDQHSSQSTGNRRRNGPTRSILREFEGPTFSVDEGGDILANGGSQHSYSLRYHEALCDSCLPRRNQPHELVQLDDCAARGRGDCPSSDFLVHHRGRGASSQHPQPRRRPAKSGEVPVELMRLPKSFGAAASATHCRDLDRTFAATQARGVPE